MFRSIFAIALWFVLSVFSGPASAKFEGGPDDQQECEEALGAPLEDPFTAAEMGAAIKVAHELRSSLQNWATSYEPFDRRKLADTLRSVRRSHVDLDSAEFRHLFYIVQRYLLAMKGANGRVRPLSELLKIEEKEVHRLVNFISQLDVAAHKNEADHHWPKFLRLANDPERYFAELAGGETFPPRSPARAIIRAMVQVMGSRVRYADFHMDAAQQVLTIKSPVAVYRVAIRPDALERSLIAPLRIGATKAWERQNDLLVNSSVKVWAADEDAQSYLRTMIRADAFFHPHLIPPSMDLHPQPVQPSEIQAQAIARLMALDREAAEDKATADASPVELAEVDPTGLGKTVITAGYIKELQKSLWSGKKPKIVVITENLQILRQTVHAFVRDLGLNPGKIFMLFGDNAKLSPASDFELIVTTRSTAHARLSGIESWIEAENAKPEEARRPFFVMIDEAHHIATEMGQYTDILKAVRAKATREDRILYASATLWPSDIIVNIVKGRVTGSYLKEDELRKLQAGQDLERLARTQYLRATIDGYLNPIDERSLTVIDGDDSTFKRLKKYNGADEELYDYLAKVIRKVRSPGIRDRYVIFEVNQRRAEDGAGYLQNAMGNANSEDLERTRVSWFMHSSIPLEEQNRRLRWFKDEEEFRGTRDRSKYFNTVSQFLEGVDVRSINGLAVMRNVSALRVLQQLLGRGARLEPFKQSLRVIDVPGVLADYLEDAGDLYEVGFPYKSRLAFRDKTAYGLAERQPPEEIPSLADPEFRPLEIEASMAREVRESRAWRAISAEELAVFKSQRGGRSLLRFDPVTARSQVEARLKTLFTTWFERFPEDARAHWRDQMAVLKLSDELIRLDRISDAQMVQAIRGFHLLNRMFNGLPIDQRLGFEALESSDQAEASAQVRILAALDPRFNFVTANAAPKLSGDYLKLPLARLETNRLAKQLESGELLGGIPVKVQRGILNAAFGDGSSLAAIEAVLKERPALRTARVLKAVKAAKSAITLAQYNSQPLEDLEKYYVSLIANTYIAEFKLDEKPWDMNPFFGLDTWLQYDGEKYNRYPSVAEFWRILSRAEVESR